MPTAAVLAPVLRRPERALPFARSLRETGDHLLIFLVSPSDREQWQACLSASHDCRPGYAILVSFEPERADWAKKINRGIEWIGREFPEVEWVLLGADDLRFHPGWAEAAIRVGEETDACVVGTNDLGNRTVMKGEHSTHPLVHRDYLKCGTIDDPELLVPECYHHNFVDTEFVETAKARGVWAFAPESKVEHLHPFWHKGDDDAVYRIGREHYADDQRLFLKRRALWSDGDVQTWSEV